MAVESQTKSIATTLQPHSQWSITENMLVETLGDLTITWVQEYLLNPNALHDAKVLSNPDACSAALRMSFSSRMTENSDAEGTTNYVRLNVPSFFRGHIGAGVAVESSSGTGLGLTVFPLTRFVPRYIVNMVTGNQLLVLHNEAAGRIECTFLSNKTFGLWTSTILHFDMKTFRAAFRSGNMDIFVLRQALLSGIFTTVAGCTQNQQQISAYPYKVAENVGHHRNVSSVFCVYGGNFSNPIMTFSVRHHGIWRLSIKTDIFENLKKWGVESRLAHAKFHSWKRIPTKGKEDDDVENPLEAGSQS